MASIKIRVNKQIDGFTFSTLPSMRDTIRKQWPGAYPANNIFVGYDTNCGSNIDINKLERYLYPALLGINDTTDLKSNFEIEFIDTQTEQIIHKISNFVKEI